MTRSLEDDNLLTAADIRVKTGLSPSTLKRARDRGELEFLDGNPVRYWESDVLAWLQSRCTRTRHARGRRARSKWRRENCVTVADIFERYERYHVDRKVSSSETYYYGKKNLMPFFGDMDVTEILPDDVHEYESMREAGEIGRPSKPPTIRRELSVLVAAINYAVKYRIIEQVDAPYIPLPRDSTPKDRWLTKEEANRLLDACQLQADGNGLSLVFIFTKIALNTGARRGAIRDLRWDQVDFENEIIHFNPPGRRQTKKRRASVPINGDLLTVLELAWDQRDENSEYVLGRDRGKIPNRFRRAVNDAGLKNVTPHTLRHTYGTWAAQRGVPIWKIAGVMGDTVTTASRHYLHHSPDELRDAV